MIKVVPLPVSIIGQYYHGDVDVPVIVYGGVVDGHVYVCGGLMWRDGKCWGWLDVFGDISRQSRQLMRWIERFKRQAKQLGENELYIWRDARLPRSERLLTLAGFELCGCDAATGQEIFSCQVSKLPS
jgi:hypothetical protein